ncbi:hypothetical protein [Paraburkholderia sp. 32]
MDQSWEDGKAVSCQIFGMAGGRDAGRAFNGMAYAALLLVYNIPVLIIH